MSTVYAQRDANGYYRVGELLYPSISTMLKPIKGDYPDDPFYCWRGTLTHGAVQAFLEGDLHPSDVLGWLEVEVIRNGFDIDLRAVIGGAEHGIGWCRRHVRSVHRIETPGVNVTVGYAGTPDWFGVEVDGIDGLALIDAKRMESKTPERWHIAQLAMCLHLEHVALATGPGEPYGGEYIRHFGNLCITSDGAFLRTYTPQQVGRAWKHCVLPTVMERYYNAHTDGWGEDARRTMRAYLSTALERRGAWLAEPRRKRTDPGHIGNWPEVEPKRPASKRSTRSAADDRARHNAELFGLGLAR